MRRGCAVEQWGKFLLNIVICYQLKKLDIIFQEGSITQGRFWLVFIARINSTQGNIWLTD